MWSNIIRVCYEKKLLFNPKYTSVEYTSFCVWKIYDSREDSLLFYFFFCQSYMKENSLYISGVYWSARRSSVKYKFLLEKRENQRRNTYFTTLNYPIKIKLQYIYLFTMSYPSRMLWSGAGNSNRNTRKSDSVCCCGWKWWQVRKRG